MKDTARLWRERGHTPKSITQYQIAVIEIINRARNRQSDIYAREGIVLDRSTLAGWVGAASELVAPLVDEIRKHVLAASKIHADDTPVPVLAPGNGKTKTGRLWTYVSDDRPAAQSTAPAVWFAYSEIARENIRVGI